MSLLKNTLKRNILHGNKLILLEIYFEYFKTDSETEFFKDYKNEYFNKYSILGKQAKRICYYCGEKNDTANN